MPTQARSPPSSLLSPAEAARRERNRNKVRRSYYRKIFNLNELRTQVSLLEDEYERILERHEQCHKGPQQLAIAPQALAVHPGILVPDRPDEQLSLLELARIRKSLCEENEALRKRTMEHVKAHGSLQHILEAQRQEEDDGSATQQQKLALLLVRPFTTEECIEITRRAYTEIMEFRENQNCVTTGASVCGWQDQRYFHDGVLTYLFKKSFPHCDFDQLVDATWELLRDPPELARLYSPSLNMRFHVVQQFDENNVIYFRLIDQFDKDVVLKSLFLLSRFRTENGYIILSYGLDPSRMEDDFLTCAPQHKSQVWKNVYSWIVFERDAENGCSFSFGGAVKTDNALTVFWLIEVLLVVLRWEAKIVGPLFVLTQGEGNDETSSEGSFSPDPHRLAYA